MKNTRDENLLCLKEMCQKHLPEKTYLGKNFIQRVIYRIALNPETRHDLIQVCIYYAIPYLSLIELPEHIVAFLDRNPEEEIFSQKNYYLSMFIDPNISFNNADIEKDFIHEVKLLKQKIEEDDSIIDNTGYACLTNREGSIFFGNNAIMKINTVKEL